jgi:endoglucanase Acf2
MRMHSRHFFLAVSVLAAIGCGENLPQVASSSMTKLGPGSYSKELVPGEKPPSDDANQPAKPKITEDFAQIPATNDWWSSLIWKFQAKTGSPHSHEMFPHPLTLKANAGGVELGYPTRPVVDAKNYEYPHVADVVAGVAELAAPDARVASYSDWAVTAELKDASRRMRFTAGHGLPFVYVSAVTGQAAVSIVGADAGSAVRKQSGNVALLNVRDHWYAAFASPGSTWELRGSALVSDLAGGNYYSVAVLPDDKPETLALFTKHAFSFVTGTRVDYKFDPAQGALVATFSFTTEDQTNKAPGAGTLFAMYRHQYLGSKAAPLASYVSPRGEMKLAEGTSFEVVYPLGTLLPALPPVGGYDRGRMVGMLKQGVRRELFPVGLEGTRDTYWIGKSFGRNADLVYVADQLGKTGLRDTLLDAIKEELEDWFDGQNPSYFYYDETWHTVIGIPSQYFSGSMMNDHHFHYGYFIYAAATVAQFDPEWAKRWQPLVEMLIRDAGNWDREDKQFPFMRNFDIYAGHSWASGTTWGPRGNNEESSSEDVNYASAMALWGEVMGRPEIRDAGLFMYASLVSATEQYWFDVDEVVFPEGFAHPSVGIVWGNGGLYDTWFSYLPAFIHGIQITPFSNGSLWFGRRPENIKRNLEHLRKGNYGDLHIWREMFWMMEALENPQKAAQRFEDEHWFEPEGGGTLAHTYHVLAALEQLGKLDTSVRGDVPFSAVFTDAGGKKRYVAFNGGAKKRSVRFSDGTTLEAGPRELAVK